MAGKVIQYVAFDAGESQEAYHREIMSEINRQIDRLKYIYVYEWNADYVAQIHKNHKPVFILITNNESVSHAAYNSYLRIREEWSTLSEYAHYPFVRFTAADLTRNLQETTEVRRELTGTLISDRKEYSYPVLGFFSYNKKEDRVQRYLFPVDEECSYHNALNWMNHVVEVVVLGKDQKDLKQSQTFKHPTEEWFLHDPDENEPDLAINFNQTEQYMVSMDYKRFVQAMTSLMKESFFVLYMWKNYEVSLTIFNFLRKLWSDEDRVSPKVAFYYVVRNVDEFPPIKELQVDFFPALIHVTKQKEITVLQGVTNRDRIIKFMEEKEGKIEMKPHQEKSDKKKKK